MHKFLFILGLILIAVFLSGCSSKPVRIEGTAMLPNFRDGDKVLMDAKIGELKRGDVIMFLYPKDTKKWYIKRVIGLPGETIETRAGQIYINGQSLDEPYIDETYNQAKANFAPKAVPENSYFVIGDNRDNSSDSRYWGAVPKELIKGKYYMTYSKAQE